MEIIFTKIFIVFVEVDILTNQHFEATRTGLTESLESPFSNFKETISMRNPEVYGKFAFTVYI
jgi:hypothetical protein